MDAGAPIANAPRVKRQSRALTVVVPIVALLAWYFLLRPAAPHPVAPSPSEDRAPIAEPVTSTEPEAPPVAPAVTAPLAPLPEPAPRRAAAAEDPCAPMDDDQAAHRPSIAHLLEAREGELIARFGAQDERASPALREGIHLLAIGQGEAALERLATAPDRAVQGFDHAAAAAVHLGLGALAAGHLGEARRHARRASTLDRSDPTGPLLESIVADREEDSAGARDALLEARARDGDDPAIAWALAIHLVHTEALSTAVAALDTYLEVFSDDVPARRLRERTAREATSAEGTTRRARDGVVLLAPSSLDAAIAERALGTVVLALSEAARWTRTERARELVVLVHPDRAALRASTCAPAWGGAIFDGLLHTDVETLRDGAVAQRVLRHETLHAQLHARPGHARASLPYWLDEGLAQRFAEEEGADHHRSWALMVREHVWIPFASVEGPFVEIDDPSDARLAYHQSLAIVRYLESVRGSRAAADVIAAADRGVAPAALLAEIAPELDGERLLAFLAAVPDR